MDKILPNMYHWRTKSYYFPKEPITKSLHQRFKIVISTLARPAQSQPSPLVYYFDNLITPWQLQKDDGAVIQLAALVTRKFYGF